MMPRRRTLSLIAILYGVSGALGLVYEVAFNKYLGGVFGTTAYASSAVLVAFMGGLALGAHLASRLDARIRRPLLAYGIAEAIIGAFCMLAPFGFTLLNTAHGWCAARHPDALTMLDAVRAGLAVVVALVPAAGMGATLPLLARFVASEDPVRGKRLLARLYAINTLGGALGSLVCAYAIVPGLGLTWTMRSAATLSLGIGIVAMLLGREREIELPTVAADSAPEVGSESAASPFFPMREAIVLSAASGMLVFGCEIVFVHLLGLALGKTGYAFGLMLAIFLVCLSFGTPVATKLADRFGAGAMAIGLTVSGLLLLASVVLWERMPSLFVLLDPVFGSWGARELVRAVVAFAALALPVVSMGTTFPLVLRAARSATIGADVGKLTVANTAGSILGSLAFGFGLLPRLGPETSLLAVAVVYVVLAVFANRKGSSSARARDGERALLTNGL
ncbi:hypothetical protein AKJ09_02974 [Labilithrix luteola]|uniref:Spermidine synthase n=1 Tax=Labilithrix luteola TaxID=1391654 RepID=A0A0K1PRZ6_9BACT|nr:hypothetical protein [Labilithrix luteola]AKU96310.1 hypothetical protein AKJ09_02974 [Labilithrix luteola]